MIFPSPKHRSQGWERVRFVARFPSAPLLTHSLVYHLCLTDDYKDRAYSSTSILTPGWTSEVRRRCWETKIKCGQDQFLSVAPEEELPVSSGLWLVLSLRLLGHCETFCRPVPLSPPLSNTRQHWIYQDNLGLLPHQGPDHTCYSVFPWKVNLGLWITSSVPG